MQLGLASRPCHNVLACGLQYPTHGPPCVSIMPSLLLLHPLWHMQVCHRSVPSAGKHACSASAGGWSDCAGPAGRVVEPLCAPHCSSTEAACDAQHERACLCVLLVAPARGWFLPCHTENRAACMSLCLLQKFTRDGTWQWTAGSGTVTGSGDGEVRRQPACTPGCLRACP